MEEDGQGMFMSERLMETALGGGQAEDSRFCPLQWPLAPSAVGGGRREAHVGTGLRGRTLARNFQFVSQSLSLRHAHHFRHLRESRKAT